MATRRSMVVSRVFRKFVRGSGPVPVSGCSRVLAPFLTFGWWFFVRRPARSRAPRRGGARACPLRGSGDILSSAGRARRTTSVLRAMASKCFIVGLTRRSPGQASGQPAAPCRDSAWSTTGCRRCGAGGQVERRLGVGKGADHASPSADLAHDPLERVVGPQAPPVGFGETVIGELYEPVVELRRDAVAWANVALRRYPAWCFSAKIAGDGTSTDKEVQQNG